MANRASPGSLSQVLEETWALLARAAQERRSALCSPAMATIGVGGEPNARTVDLWCVEPERRRLYFNTDIRSAKHRELGRVPWAMFVFYDEALATQLRFRCEMRLHHDDPLARRGWNELPRDKRRLYLTARPPGTVAPQPTTGLPEGLKQRVPTPDECDAGYRNFSVLEAIPRYLDWLHFAPTGHRRAAFEFANDREVRASWLYP